MGTYITIRKVQMGLTQARAQGMTIASPGAIDGAWGPITEASLDAYLSSIVPPFHGEVGVEPESGRLEIGGESDPVADSAQIAGGLNQLAMAYESAHMTSQATSTTSLAPPSAAAAQRRARPEAAGPLVLNASRPRWGLWLGALLALGVIGGGIWWFMRKGKF